MDEQITITFRAPLALKKAFDRVAKDLDMTPSQILRASMKKWVEQYASQQGRLDFETTVETPDGDVTVMSSEPIQTKRPEAIKPAKKPAKGQKLNRMPPRGKT